MSQITFAYGSQSVSAELLTAVDISIENESKTITIPGGQPITKPIAAGGKTVEFEIIIYGSDFTDFQSKVSGFENFVETYGPNIITITCSPMSNYSGNYIISLSGQLRGELKNQAIYRIQARKA